MQIQIHANTQIQEHTNSNAQIHKHTNTHAQMQKYTNSCRWRSRWIHQSLERWYIQREEEEKDQHNKPTFRNTHTYKRIQTNTNLQIQDLISDKIQVTTLIHPSWRAVSERERQEKIVAHNINMMPVKADSQNKTNLVIFRYTYQ